MPVDPRHGRFIPAGQRLARVLARVLRAYFPYARAAAARGEVSDLWGMEQALYKASLPVLPLYWHAGHRSAMKDVQAMFRRRRRSGKSVRGMVRKSPLVPSIGIPIGPTGSVIGSFDVTDPGIPDAVKRLALELAGEVTESTKQMVREQLTEGLMNGESGQEIADRLEPAFGAKRANVISRTESSRVYHDAHTTTWKSYGITHHEWLASSDACDNCKFLNDDVVEIGKPFIVLMSGNPAYSVIKYPPLHPNCVLAETPVLVSGLITATHAEYQGPVVRLGFGDGSRVAVTPNHMLLTTTGFARAQDLVEGDDVLRAGPGPVESLPAGCDPDDNWRPARADEVFGTASVASGVVASRVPVAPEYLHGDAAGVHGEIDVVRTSSLLGSDFQLGVGEPPKHLTLVDGLYDTPGFLRYSTLAQVFHALFHATNRRVGRFRELTALAWCKSRHADRGSFSTLTYLESQLLQTASYNRAADAERLRHTQDTFPGLVTTTKVVSVHHETLRHRVPVYDFETASSMYLVGRGIISSNCMCTTVPREAPVEKKTARRLPVLAGGFYT